MKDNINPDKVLIYIPLVDEGTDVARPTYAEVLGGNIFRVLPSEKYDPNNEKWKFPPGTIVKCEKKIMRDTEAKEVLLAIDKYSE